MCPVSGTAAAGAATAGAASAGMSAGTAMAISTAISAVTTGITYMARQQAANKQAEYQAEVTRTRMQHAANMRAYEETKQKQQAEYLKQNAEAARKAYIEETAQENIRMMQENEAVSQEMQELTRKRREEMGTAIASSEGAGLSFDSLMADYYRKESGYRDSLLRQKEWGTLQSSFRKDGMQAKAENRANSVRPYVKQPVSKVNPKPAPVDRPSLLGAGLSVVGIGWSNYNKYSVTDPKTGRRSLPS